jgi:hypothetical protein
MVGAKARTNNSNRFGWGPSYSEDETIYTENVTLPRLDGNALDRAWTFFEETGWFLASCQHPETLMRKFRKNADPGGKVVSVGGQNQEDQVSYSPPRVRNTARNLLQEMALAEGKIKRAKEKGVREILEEPVFLQNIPESTVFSEDMATEFEEGHFNEIFVHICNPIMSAARRQEKLMCKALDGDENTLVAFSFDETLSRLTLEEEQKSWEGSISTFDTAEKDKEARKKNATIASVVNSQEFIGGPNKKQVEIEAKAEELARFGNDSVSLVQESSYRPPQVKPKSPALKKGSYQPYEEPQPQIIKYEFPSQFPPDIQSEESDSQAEEKLKVKTDSPEAQAEKKLEVKIDSPEAQAEKTPFSKKPSPSRKGGLFKIPFKLRKKKNKGSQEEKGFKQEKSSKQKRSWSLSSTPPRRQLSNAKQSPSSVSDSLLDHDNPPSDSDPSPESSPERVKWLQEDLFEEKTPEKSPERGQQEPEENEVKTPEKSPERGQQEPEENEVKTPEKSPERGQQEPEENEVKTPEKSPERGQQEPKENDMEWTRQVFVDWSMPEEQKQDQQKEHKTEDLPQMGILDDSTNRVLDTNARKSFQNADGQPIVIEEVEVLRNRKEPVYTSYPSKVLVEDVEVLRKDSIRDILGDEVTVCSEFDLARRASSFCRELDTVAEDEESSSEENAGDPDSAAENKEIVDADSTEESKEKLVVHVVVQKDDETGAKAELGAALGEQSKGKVVVQKDGESRAKAELDAALGEYDFRDDHHTAASSSSVSTRSLECRIAQEREEAKQLRLMLQKKEEDLERLEQLLEVNGAKAVIERVESGNKVSALTGTAEISNRRAAMQKTDY